MNVVHERQVQRLRFLLSLYEAVEADRMQRVNYREIAQKIDLDEPEATKAAQYLVDEHLAEWAALGGSIAISHWGIKEAEFALQEKPTEHFSDTAINVVVVNSGGKVGNIQQGTTESEQST